MFDTHKTEYSGYVWWKNYFNILSHFHTIPERDGQTDRILITIPRVSVLTRDKMYPLCNNKSWDLLLFSVIIELATSNLVHNFRFAQYAVKTTFRSKIAEGAGLGEHNKNFGTPLQLLNLTTSFLVHNLDLGSGLPKSFRTKIGEIWVRGAPQKFDPPYLFL